ncbi:hypothetical protein EYR41_008468 [Orbilia oligospora]|uniref:Uncharacterized protein n=1 Tax=Orbilia oligospora TaxID=2813651 RepID=A0A7C8P7C8_ORBOL|nr:hypothetical protein TWF751_001068 [Orbilia oligospora]TGJ66871.1 hypothetical protein EYR41_008468 [Orbilia oligospora]
MLMVAWDVELLNPSFPYPWPLDSEKRVSRSFVVTMMTAGQSKYAAYIETPRLTKPIMTNVMMPIDQLKNKAAPFSGHNNIYLIGQDKHYGTSAL